MNSTFIIIYNSIMCVCGWMSENVNVYVFIFDVIVYIACHLPLTHLLGITVQFNKFYSILFVPNLFRALKYPKTFRPWTFRL